MGNTSFSSGGSDSLKKCLPTSKLVTFPHTMNSASGNLVTYFNAKPPGYSIPESTSEENMFWWTDIDFIPFQDNRLFISVGAYIYRPNMSPLKVTPSLQGLIYVWTFKANKHRVEILKGSRTSALPNISVHPSGENILFVGSGDIHLMNVFSMKEVTRSRDASMSTFQCCAQSPSGDHIAYIQRMSSKVDVGFCYWDNGLFLAGRGVLDCNKLCPGFKSNGSYNERYQCKFSKDSSCVAFSSSFGHLIVVTVGTQELFCSVSPGIVDWTTDRLANERSFDFDPRHPHEKIAFGSDRRNVYICDTVNACVENSFKLEEEGDVQCLKYSPSGNVVAVALSLGMVHLLDPDTGNCCLTLDAVNLIQDAAIKTVMGELAQVVQMKYTTHGEHLAVSYTDGYVRIWKLGQDLNLQDLCSRALLQLVTLSNLAKLPLPRKILEDIFVKYAS